MAKQKKLTIGMATYDDYDGVYFSIKAIQLYHSEILDKIEFLVLDNNPDGKHAIAVREFLKREVKGARYLPIRDKATSFTKYRVFEFANTPYVLCMDSHVLFEKGALKKLLAYYKENPDTKDLLQGPLIIGNEILTHWDNKWWNGQFGYWVTDKRGINPEAASFEIKTQGMGMLSSRKDAFPQINSLFNGFGGEEGYIQEKFRRNGAKALLLPFLRWHHRFDNKKPTQITYPRSMHDRIRNNIIAHVELGWDVMPLFKHFTQEYKIKDISNIYVDVVRDLQQQGSRVKVSKLKLAYMEQFCKARKLVHRVSKRSRK